MSYKSLSLNSSGADVAKLHGRLQKLGFQLRTSEVADKKFGYLDWKGDFVFGELQKAPLEDIQ